MGTRPRADASRIPILVTVALLLVLAAGPVSAETTGGGTALAPQLQADLEAALKVKIDGLLSAKNEDGLPYKRGTYSKTFEKVDDSTYLASFHQDEAGK